MTRLDTRAISEHDVTVHLGHVLDVLPTLPAKSVQCCVTSPPYYDVRAYSGDPREIGHEPTVDLYVAALVNVFREVRRVLSDDGTLWLNLGDRWINDQMALIPARVALALKADGWMLRIENIWAKRNGLPDGQANDRPHYFHEQVFLFSKQRRYYYDADAIREQSDPEQEAHNRRYARVYDAHTANAPRHQPGNVNNVGIHARPGKGGRAKRSVWWASVASSGSSHTARMPDDIAEPCILAGAPLGGIVLDPFAGTGTTARVARSLGRKSVGIELNPECVDLLRDRIGQTPLDFGESA